MEYGYGKQVRTCKYQHQFKILYIPFCGEYAYPSRKKSGEKQQYKTSHKFLLYRVIISHFPTAPNAMVMFIPLHL